jgi:hypothetical protein
MQPYAATKTAPVKPKPQVNPPPLKPGDKPKPTVKPFPKSPTRPDRTPSKPPIEVPKPAPPKPKEPVPKSVPKPFIRPKPKSPPPVPTPVTVPVPARKPIPIRKPFSPTVPFVRPRPGFDPSRNNPITTPEIERIKRRREEERRKNNPSRKERDWGDERSPFYDPSRPLFHPLKPDTWDQPIQKPREYGPYDPATDDPFYEPPNPWKTPKTNPWNFPNPAKNFPWPKPKPDTKTQPKPKPDLDPSGRPWSKPEDLDKIFKPWETFPEPQPEENPNDGPIWTPVGETSENPDSCITAIRFHDKADPRAWGWLGFQEADFLTAQNKIGMMFIGMNNGTASDAVIREYQNRPLGGVITGYSLGGNPYWEVSLPGIGGNFDITNTTNPGFNVLRGTENKRLNIQNFSNLNTSNFEYEMMILCPEPYRKPDTDEPNPDNPYPEDDPEMTCRYLKDLQRIVTVKSFNEASGNFDLVEIRCHEAEIDVPKYLSNELEKINRRLDHIYHATEAKTLQTTNGLLIKPKDDFAVMKTRITRDGQIRARTIREVETALLTQVEHLDAVAAIPEWWSNRVGANRPQLVIQYAEKMTDGRLGAPMYAINIPHYNKSMQDTVKGLFPAYRKGSRMCVCIMPDNGKLIVNTHTDEIGENLITTLLNSTSVKKADCQISTGSRKGGTLKDITVYPKIAKFFATGQKDAKPTWIKFFNETP